MGACTYKSSYARHGVLCVGNAAIGLFYCGWLRGVTSAWWNFSYIHTSSLFGTSGGSPFWYKSLGKQYIQFVDTGIGINYTIPAALEGHWCSVVLQYNGGEVTPANRFRLYYNTVEIVRDGSYGGNLPTSFSTTIHTYNFYSYETGSVFCDYRTGLGVLSSDDRLFLYNNGFGQPQSLRGTLSGLQNEYLFSEGTGTKVRDSVGGMHGWFYGSAAWVGI